jgi:hypothetical protein
MTDIILKFNTPKKTGNHYQLDTIKLQLLIS